MSADRASASGSEDARKAFLKELLIPSPERGKLRCRLCNETVWGPNGTCLGFGLTDQPAGPQDYLILRNVPEQIQTIHTDSWSCPLTLATSGRYHPDKCPEILEARKKAQKENLKLVNVGGIPFREELFKQLKPPKPKPAKVKGFVVSSSALRDDPRIAPSPNDKGGSQRTGKKGYNRCLACNTEVFAPNTRRHERTCPKRK